MFSSIYSIIKAEKCSNALLPHLPAAEDDVLRRRECLQAHRAARVELLGADADLRAEAELEAVGEARRGVDVDGGGVDLIEKAHRVLVVLRDDRFRVPGVVAVDVCDRLVER